MGNPAYDARREAERAEAEKDKAAAVALELAADGMAAFFRGEAFIEVVPGNVRTIIRFVPPTKP